jgi:hypothetical protein
MRPDPFPAAGETGRPGGSQVRKYAGTGGDYYPMRI